MAKGDERELGRFSRWRLFFKILKTRKNQQPDIYSIPKLWLGLGLGQALGMLSSSGC